MATIAGLGLLVLEFFRTIVIDSVIKVLLYPNECYTPQIKLGGPLLENN